MESVYRKVERTSEGKLNLVPLTNLGFNSSDDVVDVLVYSEKDGDDAYLAALKLAFEDLKGNAAYNVVISSGKDMSDVDRFGAVINGVDDVGFSNALYSHVEDLRDTKVSSLESVYDVKDSEANVRSANVYPIHIMTPGHFRLDRGLEKKVNDGGRMVA